MLSLVKVKDIVHNDKCYPRLNKDWLTAYKYAEAMKSGADFPPITVTLRKRIVGKGKYLLIDGWHRLEASKKNKETHIQADVLDSMTNDQVYIEAVKRNVAHGRILTVQERANIIVRLQDMKLEMGEISRIVCIPADKLEPFVVKRVTHTVTGEFIALKAPLKHMAGIDVESSVKDEQDIFSARAQISYLNELIRIIENGWLNLANGDVKRATKKLYGLLQQQFTS